MSSGYWSRRAGVRFKESSRNFSPASSAGLREGTAAEEDARMAKVAVIGAGLIGRAWAMVFARAGWEVALYDAVAGIAEAGLKSIGEGLRALAQHGLADDPAGAATRLRAAPQLPAALDGASFVQENVPET